MSVLELLNKTEANIKLIESLGDGFVTPVLNEWRYVTRHIVEAEFGDDKSKSENLQKCESHLKRAYFDSCDIIIVCMLAKLAAFNSRYLKWADVVVKVVPDYPKYIDRCRLAQRKHLEAQSVHGEDRVAAFDSLTAVISDLREITDVLEYNSCQIAIEVHKAKVKSFWEGFAKAGTVIATAVAITQAILWIVQLCASGGGL